MLDVQGCAFLSPLGRRTGQSSPPFRKIFRAPARFLSLSSWTQRIPSFHVRSAEEPRVSSGRQLPQTRDTAHSGTIVWSTPAAWRLCLPSTKRNYGRKFRGNQHRCRCHIQYAIVSFADPAILPSIWLVTSCHSPLPTAMEKRKSDGPRPRDC